MVRIIFFYCGTVNGRQGGQQLRGSKADGSIMVATITKISDKTVTLDANVPLAGKDLTFEIGLVKILQVP